MREKVAPIKPRKVKVGDFCFQKVGCTYVPLPGPLSWHSYNPGCCACSDLELLCNADPQGPGGPGEAPAEAPSFPLSSCIPGVESKRPATQKHRQAWTDPSESHSVWTKDQQRGASQGRAAASAHPRGGQAGSRDFLP